MIGVLRKGFTLVELLVTIAIIGILVAMTVPAVQMVREAARNSSCKNKLRQVSISFMNYESAHGQFPPGQLAGTLSADGTFDDSNSLMVGHLGFVLGFLEQSAFQKEIQASPWRIGATGSPWYWDDSLLDKMQVHVDVFLCPSDDSRELGRTFVSRRSVGGLEPGTLISQTAAWTNYLGSCGSVPTAGDNKGVLFENSTIGFGDILDGSSNTVLAGEVVGGYSTGEASVGSRHSIFQNGIGGMFGYFEANGSDSIGEPVIAIFSSSHYGGISANFAMCDGSVRTISANAEKSVMDGLLTRNGGETSYE